MGFGWLFGIMGWSWTIAATAFGATTLYICFDLIKNNPRLHMMVQYIMSVVCGMLLETALSLLRQASLVMADKKLLGINIFIAAAVVLGITLVMIILHKKWKINDIIILLLGGGGALAVLGLMYHVG